MLSEGDPDKGYGMEGTLGTGFSWRERERKLDIPTDWHSDPPPVLGQGGDYTSMLPDPGVAVMRGPVGHHRAPGYEEYYANPQHSSVNYLFQDQGLPDPGVQTQTTSQNPQYSGRAAQRQAAKEYVSTPGNVTASVESTPRMAESIAPGIQGLNSFLDGLDNLIASLRSW